MFRLFFNFFPFLFDGIMWLAYLLDIAFMVVIAVIIWKKLIRPFVRAAEKYVDSESQGKNGSEQ